MRISNRRHLKVAKHQVEIIGPDGKVHYRRPHNHPDVSEALRTLGYSVRFPNMHMTLLEEIGCRDGVAYPVTLSADGMLVEAVPLPSRGENYAAAKIADQHFGRGT